MAQDNLNDFYTENRKLLTDYLDVRLQLLRLGSIRTLSRTLAMLILLSVISLMALLFLVFMVIAFSVYMSNVLESSVWGFVCGGLVFLFILLLTIALRKPLFLNPLIRLFIITSAQEDEEDEEF
jgi:hypothetical protein